MITIMISLGRLKDKECKVILIMQSFSREWIYPCYRKIKYRHIRNYCSSAALYAGQQKDKPKIKIENDKVISPLIHLGNALIEYPQSTTSALDRINFNIWPNVECGSGGGGHIILGRNGAGKTLLSRSLLQLVDYAEKDDQRSYIKDDDDNKYHKDTYKLFLQIGDVGITKRNINNKNRRNHKFISHVSFQSHSELLRDPNTTTVHKALIPGGGNRLSNTAKFLSVRLGMYPLLPRYVNTLSTGEIRRVLLVRALVSKPELLVLDNAFDGLDVKGREGLQDIIERVLKGFRMDVLVQGVGDAKDTARTQIMLMTHRPEEISDGFGRVSFIDRNGMRTEDRNERRGEDLVRSLSPGDYTSATNHPWDVVSSEELPSDDNIRKFWNRKKPKQNDYNEDVLVHAEDLQVTRDDTTLLTHLNWTVKRGERWHVAGVNGSGKSTLGRLILRRSLNNNLQDANKHDANITNGSLNVLPSVISNKRGGVAWVSTELHLHASHNWGHLTVEDIILFGTSFLFNADRNKNKQTTKDTNMDDYNTAATALNLIGLIKENQIEDIVDHPFLSRLFSTLSQGEQKLLLIASAIGQRPEILILDEPCQSLDIWNRGRILAIVEKLCRVTDMSLLYITHHEEELIPSITHRLSLDDGKVMHCGLI